VAGDGSAEAELLSAVALQVQAAWLRPNLLHLMHAWLLQAGEGEVTAVHVLRLSYDLVNTQLAPAMHPAVVQLGLGGPAMEAAVAAVGSKRLQEVQVSSGCGAAGQQLLERV
jgi:hypothetical protein